MSTAETNETLEPGTRIANFTIQRALGAGQFGAVYEARRDDGLRVALKVLHVAMEKDDEIVVRFTREAKAIALLKHPNIVAPVEVGEHEGRPYLAMEYLQGEVLGSLMKRVGKLPLREALDIAVPLMSAMRNVHAQSMVHRDLKPDNVFITRNEAGIAVPKILDFGFAKMAEPGLQLTGKDTAIGTPNFMSPEQMLSPRSVDPRSDQWALGVLLYYMLTGIKPFDGRVLAETLKNVLQRDPTPVRELLPELPEKVAVSVMRTLRKPPAERFETVHDFAQSLLPFARDTVAFAYATEYFAASVWEQLGVDAPSTEADAARVIRRPRRSGAGRTGAQSAATSRPPPRTTGSTTSARPAARSSPPGDASTPPSDRSMPRPTRSTPSSDRSLPPSDRSMPRLSQTTPSSDRSPRPSARSSSPSDASLRSAARSSPPAPAVQSEPPAPPDPLPEIDFVPPSPKLPPLVIGVVVVAVVLAVGVMVAVLRG